MIIQEDTDEYTRLAVLSSSPNSLYSHFYLFIYLILE